MLRVGVQASRRQYVCRERDGGTLLHVLACVGGRLLVASASEVEISVRLLVELRAQDRRAPAGDGDDDVLWHVVDLDLDC